MVVFNLYLPRIPLFAILLNFLLGIYSCLNAEVFEQSMFLYHVPTSITLLGRDNLSVNLNLCMSLVSAHESFDPDGNNVPLFGRYGEMDFDVFAKNKVSYSFNGPSIYDPYSKTMALKNDINSLFSSYEKKNVYCAGKLNSFEVAFMLKVAMPHQPFYMSIDLPFRLTSVKKMEFASVASQQSIFTDFLNANMDAVLEENNFEALHNGYEAKGVSDIIAKLGWSNQEHLSGTLVRFVWGDIAIGVSLPLSIMTQSPKNFLFHIPLGHGGSLGALLQYKAGIEFNRKMEFIVFGENWLFLYKNNLLHILNHKDMGCFNLFRESTVQSCRGPYWVAGAIFKTRLLFEGLYATFGYSYHSQEQSAFNITRPDNDLLYDLNKLESFLAQNPSLSDGIAKYDRENNFFYPVSNMLINKDPRLQRSYAHIIHLTFLVQPIQLVDWYDNAQISFSYHQPIYGKSAFAGFGVSAQVGVGITLNF